MRLLIPSAPTRGHRETVGPATSAPAAPRGPHPELAGLPADPPARRGRTPLSLKGQALALLARREHSRQELRQKLLQHARRRLPHDGAGAVPDPFAVTAAADPWGEDTLPAQALTEVLRQEVEEVLDWLEARQYLSDTRFAEVRVHSRAARLGQSRIRQELSRAGVELPDALAQQLRETEFERARAVWQRKFGGHPATSPQDRARQARFLAGRGFAASVVWQVVGARHEEPI
ncbi:regulatory protein RecX [Ideonella livida]|uniref:Regulatory protein RecX n=1 Tax=Ideonella livida TaxID=2707176 RepID=A0A7C9PGV7_9BURK|nr:regulatory protein RecX [Ideonella livida]NDY91030.1 regulatory protein RecX [Ideonella livida]